MPGLPVWRLVAADGRVAEAYLDPVGEDEWMVTVWHGKHLHVVEVFSNRLAGDERVTFFRSTMLAEGWTDGGRRGDF